jgi:hypothetical protein
MDSDNKKASPGSQSFGDGLDLTGYVRLRTLIDSLECGAIRYMLQKSEGKGGRFDELQGKLMPIIEWVWAQKAEIGCPEGYVDCQGVCVPYPCPE